VLTNDLKITTDFTTFTT